MSMQVDAVAGEREGCYYVNTGDSLGKVIDQDRITSYNAILSGQCPID